jgi:hypothetical protein
MRNMRRLSLVGCGSLLGLVVLLCACSAPTLRIQNDFVPPGSLRLAQVTAIGTRAEIVSAGPVYDAIRSAGVPDTEIADGSAVLARIYCCGGPTQDLSSEKVNALMLYVPGGVRVEPGDVVEVRSGNPPQEGKTGALNTVTRVVQKYEAKEAECWWDPRNDKLWLRVLYCTWMPNAGWIKQEGSYPAWYKPAP